MPKYIGNDVMKICLKCGFVTNGDKDKEQKCWINKCGGTLKVTNFDYAFYCNDLPYDEKHSFKQRLRDRYVLINDNKEYDKDAYLAREDFDYQNYILSHNYRPVPKPNPNACPQCGCTQFTPVRRKWSFVTGFMTNKIDMVCNQCGYVKKG